MFPHRFTLWHVAAPAKVDCNDKTRAALVIAPHHELIVLASVDPHQGIPSSCLVLRSIRCRHHSAISASCSGVNLKSGAATTMRRLSSLMVNGIGDRFFIVAPACSA